MCDSFYTGYENSAASIVAIATKWVSPDTFVYDYTYSGAMIDSNEDLLTNLASAEKRHDDVEDIRSALSSPGTTQ